MIHGQWSVCCGDWSRRISTADGNWRQDFYDPATFHSSQLISHKRGVSVSLSPLSLLFFLLFPACLFWFSLSKRFFLCFLAHEICLPQIQKARWFKALSALQAKRLLNVFLSIMCRQEKDSAFITTSRIWQESSVGYLQYAWFCLFLLQFCASCCQKSTSSSKAYESQEEGL